jgi:hypothetical protein
MQLTKMSDSMISGYGPSRSFVSARSHFLISGHPIFSSRSTAPEPQRPSAPRTRLVGLWPATLEPAATSSFSWAISSLSLL